ncbi:MAG: hypothetical protein JSS75_03830 [Bacteroidetes bacterium]|nr:hypothetical protein [Bacteroidota bacterium]
MNVDYTVRRLALLFYPMFPTIKGPKNDTRICSRYGMQRVDLLNLGKSSPNISKCLWKVNIWLLLDPSLAGIGAAKKGRGPCRAIVVNDLGSDNTDIARARRTMEVIPDCPYLVGMHNMPTGLSLDTADCNDTENQEINSNGSHEHLRVHRYYDSC